MDRESQWDCADDAQSPVQEEEACAWCNQRGASLCGGCLEQAGEEQAEFNRRYDAFSEAVRARFAQRQSTGRPTAAEQTKTAVATSRAAASLLNFLGVSR